LVQYSWISAKCFRPALFTKRVGRGKPPFTRLHFFSENFGGQESGTWQLAPSAVEVSRAADNFPSSSLRMVSLSNHKFFFGGKSFESLFRKLKSREHLIRCPQLICFTLMLSKISLNYGIA